MNYSSCILLLLQQFASKLRKFLETEVVFLYIRVKALQMTWFSIIGVPIFFKEVVNISFFILCSSYTSLNILKILSYCSIQDL